MSLDEQKNFLVDEIVSKLATPDSTPDLYPKYLATKLEFDSAILKYDPTSKKVVLVALRAIDIYNSLDKEQQERHELDIVIFRKFSV